MDFTQEQISQIKTQYKEGIGAPTIAKQYNTYPVRIYRLLEECGITRRSFKALRKTTINHYYFSAINADNAYWLGFFYADATVYAPSIKVWRRASGRLKIDLRPDDAQYLLNQLKNCLQYTGTIKHYTHQNAFAKGPYTYSRLLVYSDQIVKDLCQLGCVPNKTFLLKRPPIPKQFYWDFIRGYIDGDGAYTVTRYPSGNHGLQIKICGTKELLQWIDRQFCVLLKRTAHTLSKRWPHRHNNNYNLDVFLGKQARFLVHQKLSGMLWLPRKKQKFESLLNE